MRVEKEDLENLKALFKVVDKASFNSLDGNGVIEIYQNLVKGRQLMAKMDKDLNAPPVEEPKKKPTKKKKLEAKKIEVSK